MASLCIGLRTTAQITSSDSTRPDRQTSRRDQPYLKNIVKTNLSSILLNNYSLTYERLLTRKISASLGYRYMPQTFVTKTALLKPVADALESDTKDQLDKLQMSCNAITAEVRFYTGRKPGARGFYAGLYGRYASFSYDFPYDFDMPAGKRLVPLKGKSNGIGGGIILGVQSLLFKRVILDIFIVGGHYGNLNGNVDGLTNLSDLTPQQKVDLKNDIESLISIGSKKNITADVQNDGVRAKIDMPFAGIRGAGITVGVAF